MNSRQRVLSAINHVEPEGLPVDLGATPSSGISAIAYDNLLQYLELKDKRSWVYDIVQQGFAIYKYSDNSYDSQKWMFPGAGMVDGTIEGAMKAGLLAYPM